MHVTTDIQTVKKALTVIKPGVAKHSPLHSLSGVKFEAKDGRVTVTASDLNLAIQTSVSAEVVEDGIAIVSHAQLTKLLKGKGPLELRTDGTDIAIKNGSLTTMKTLPAEEFPRQATQPTGDGFPLDLEALSIIIGAASKDECRPILTGVFFNGSECVATDSYRMHRVIDPDMIYPELLVSASALAAVIKNGAPATLYPGATQTKTRKANNGAKPWITDGHPSFYRNSGSSVPNAEFKEWDESYEAAAYEASIVSGPTTWTVHLIEGEFPNYRQIFPKSYPFSFDFDRDQMIHAVESVKAMCDKGVPVRLHLTGGSVVLSVKVIATDIGEALAGVNLTTPWDGDTCSGDFEIGLNPGFFIDALKTSVSDSVTLSFIDALKPVLMSESLGTRTSERLLMPVRIT